MSAETSLWLNNETLIGQAAKRGKAWHYRKEDQGSESNHYDGFIPTADVERRLFSWEPVEAALRAKAEIITPDGVQVIDIVDNTRKVIIRPDTETVFGVFRDSYQVHPFRETLLETTQQVVGDGVGIGSAGLLRGGAVAWVQFEFEDTQNVAGIDYRPFVTAYTSLDGSLASGWISGDQLIVCDNTLTLGISGAKFLVRKRHTKYSLNADTWQELRESLQLAIADQADTFKTNAEVLTNTRISEGEWAKFLTVHFGEVPGDEGRGRTQIINRNDRLTAMWRNDSRVNPWHGTAFGVVQAVNTWTHHEVKPRAGSRGDTNMWRAVSGKGAELDSGSLKSINIVLKDSKRKTLQLV